MEKTFGQTEETNNEVQQPQPQIQPQASQDETSVAVANLTSILENSNSIGSRVSKHWFYVYFRKYDNFSTKTNDFLKVDAQYQKSMQINSRNHAEDELKKCAGEILNGVRRTVEVQVVNPNAFNFQDQTILGMI